MVTKIRLKIRFYFIIWNIILLTVTKFLITFIKITKRKSKHDFILYLFYYIELYHFYHSYFKNFLYQWFYKIYF